MSELPKYARGDRPGFFEDPAIDALLVAVLELAKDVSVLRDRVEAHEHFLEAQGVATRAAFEAYSLPDDMKAAQAARRSEMIARLLRATEKL
jgi:hypothetical protein